ncbi:MAG: response regulator [Anaerolineae bacterium]|nr:response regulator [Anaerolineae bacterium]
MSHKVLVIEDERHVLKNTLDILTMEGFEARGAENGRSGVDLALKYRPDLIICDIAMPEMNGYEVLVEMRQNAETALVPFIFLTARTERSDIRRGMNLGADDYLTKPFSVGELLESVRARLSKHQVIRRAAEEQLDELRENITLSLPHELRTPLTSILGFSDIMLMDGETMSGQQVVKMASYINDAALRLSRLAENYLAYAQLEILELDPVRQKALQDHTANAEIIEMISESVAHRAQREFDLSLSLKPGEVRIQEDYLRKMVEELLDNAFKFSTAGTQVSVKGEPYGDVYRIEIKDRGRGMTADQIKRIGAFIQFDRDFYEQQGMGLGLVIARTLAELHNGKFTMESVPKQETCVSVDLPLA